MRSNFTHTSANLSLNFRKLSPAFFSQFFSHFLSIFPSLQVKLCLIQSQILLTEIFLTNITSSHSYIRYAKNWGKYMKKNFPPFFLHIIISIGSSEQNGCFVAPVRDFSSFFVWKKRRQKKVKYFFSFLFLIKKKYMKKIK